MVCSSCVLLLLFSVVWGFFQLSLMPLPLFTWWSLCCVLVDAPRRHVNVHIVYMIVNLGGVGSSLEVSNS